MPAPWVPTAVAVAAVLGHVFNPFLRLRGGKGVATAAGAISALAPRLLIVPIALFLIVFSLRRRVSEASLAAAVSLPLATFGWRWLPPAGSPDRDLLFLTVGLALLLCWTHRDNVRRIRSGEEPRLTR